MHRLSYTSLVLLLSMAQAACNTNQLLGPAPHFDLFDEEESETQSIMQTLAISISRMEDATVRELTLDERRQAVDAQLEVIQELSELLATQSVDDLVVAESNSSHNIVKENIGAFLTQVRLARSQVLKNPPNYFVAGKVAGHCQMCHEHRDKQVR